MTINISSVDELINKDVMDGFPGAVLLVMQGGRTITHSSYGYKNRYNSKGEPLANPEPMSTDTVFDLASNTKIYATLFGIMKLVSDQVLDIEKPVAYYIPELIRNKTLPVKHLLTHSSGFGPEIWFFDKLSCEKRGLFSQDRRKAIELIYNKVPFEYKFGQKNIYSDTGFMLLGLLIEKITGQMQDEYLYENIYKPLGLTRTCFNPLRHGVDKNDIASTSFGNTCNATMDYPNIRKDVIRGEVQDEKAFYSMNGVAGHAGLFSTAAEVGKLAQLIISKGTFNNKNIIQENVITNFFKPSNTDPAFGYGWRRNETDKWEHIFGNYASSKTIGHTGFTGTLTVIDPKNNLAIVLLTNKIHSKCINRQSYEGNNFNIAKYSNIVDLVFKSVSQ